MDLVELPDLAVGAPAGVAGAGGPDRQAGGRRPAVEIEPAAISWASASWWTKPFSRADGWPPRTGASPRGPGPRAARSRRRPGWCGFRNFRAIPRPGLELRLMGGQRREMLAPRRRRGSQAAARGVRRKNDIRPSQERRRGPEQPPRAGRRPERRGNVPGEEPGLKLADPIPALGQRQVTVARQMPLELVLGRTTHGRGSRSWASASAEVQDQGELRGDDVDDDAEAGFAANSSPARLPAAFR